MTNERDAVVELTSDESLQILRRHRFGRLAAVIAEEPYLFPVTFAIDGDTVYIRTAEGTKLFAAVLGNPVAFEVDDVGAVGAECAIARGTLRVVDTTRELETVDRLGLHPHVPTQKDHVIAIDVTEVTGRRFSFDADVEPGAFDAVD